MIDRRILLASVASLFGLAAFRWLRATPAQAAGEIRGRKDRRGMARAADAAAIRNPAQGGHRAPGLEPAARRSIARASSPAPAATCRCSPRRPSSKAAPAGRASISRSRTPSARPKTAPSACCAPKSTAAAAAAISATSSTTGRSRPACATAWTALRWCFIRRAPSAEPDRFPTGSRTLLRPAIVARPAIVPRSSDRGISI